jgi:hypothetical protein
MGRDTLNWPRRTGGVTAYFVAETRAPTESQAAWDNVNLTAKKLAALAPLDRARRGRRHQRRRLAVRKSPMPSPRRKTIAASTATARRPMAASAACGLRGTERFDVNNHDLGDNSSAGPLVAAKSP